MDESYAEQPQQQGTYGLPGQMNFYQNSDVIKQQLDSTEIVNGFEHFLLGEVWVKQKNANGDDVSKWVTRYDALIPKKDIGIFMLTLHNSCSKSILLSNLKDEDINKAVLNMTLSMIDWLEDYDYKKANLDGSAGEGIIRSNYPIIIRNFMTLQKAALGRARNGMTHMGITRGVTRTEMEVKHEQLNTKAPGFLSKLGLGG